MRHSIKRHAATKADVMNIVKTSLNYPQGLEQLLDATNFFESGSLPMQRVLEYVQQLGLEPGQDSDDLATLQQNLSERRHNLRLIQERKTQYVLSTDIPIQLIKEERLIQNEIQQLERRIEAVQSAPSARPPEISLAPRGQQTTPRPPEKPAGPVRNRWALLVGINTYIDRAYAPLSYCVHDVKAMEQQLTALGYTVVCMHDELDRDSRCFPTRNNVEAELRSICNSAEHDDLILVQFACHGVLRDGQRQLIMRDTRELIPTSFLALEDVETILRGSSANRRILLLDACHVGLEMGRSLTDPAFIENAFELAEGFAVIAASTSQQLAQEWHEEKHGVFTYYLLEGLAGMADRTGKGFVTVDDLKNHVISELKRWNVRQGRPLQEPNARVEGIGDMIVADHRKE
jgi:hypothetical protein